MHADDYYSFLTHNRKFNEPLYYEVDARHEAGMRQARGERRLGYDYNTPARYFRARSAEEEYLLINRVCDSRGGA